MIVLAGGDSRSAKWDSCRSGAWYPIPGCPSLDHWVLSCRAGDEAAADSIHRAHPVMARIPGNLRVVLGGFGMLALEAIGLYARGIAMYATTILLVLIAFLLIARVSLRTAGIGAALAAAFTLPWNGVLIGPVRPGDLLIFVAVGCLVAAEIGDERPLLPWWVTQLGLLIVVVAVMHVLIPTSPHFLLNRIVVGADGAPTTENQSNLGVAFKYLSGVVLLPFAFTFACMLERRALRWLTIAFTAGASVSGLIGFTDG
ncbi:MAG TPA: hypothetical protein VK816_09330, partial [Jatrophihabitantaceae bacterium]|nr:hypothetical protein [Jatrophihabitantaceae bacterium]